MQTSFVTLVAATSRTSSAASSLPHIKITGWVTFFDLGFNPNPVYMGLAAKIAKLRLIIKTKM